MHALRPRGGPRWGRSGPLAIVLLGLASWGLGCGAPADEASAAPTGRSGPRPAQVVIRTARGGAVDDVWTFPGEVRARARSSLAAGAGGAVERVTVEVGDRVERGQLLVEVDRELAAARVAVAEARVKDGIESLAQARREERRLSGLREGVVPELEREQAVSRRERAEAELAARRAEVAEARAQLELHFIRAPYDGVVTERRVDRGDWVQVGDPALEVVSDGTVDVIVDAGAALVGKVGVGDTARVIGDGAGVELRVAGVVPALDPATRTLRLRLTPAGEVPPSLLPGTSVEVAFSVRIGDERGVVVPQDGLLFDGAQTRLVLARDGVAKVVEVEVLARSGDEALVVGDGLEPGATVIVRGNERVRPGQALEVVSE